MRKLDQQFGRLDRARRYAARPYVIVVLSDHGQTQGRRSSSARYGLDELVERSLARGSVTGVAGGDEQAAMVGNALDDATGGEPSKKREKNDVSDKDTVVMGSGNLGLVYLMEERRRLTLEEMNERHPDLIPALRNHPDVGWLLVRSSEHGVARAWRCRYALSRRGQSRGRRPAAPFSPNAAEHLRRTDGFTHVADIMIGSFYDPSLETGVRSRS